MPQPTQNELEPGMGPEWSLDGVANAGIRKDTLARKMTPEETYQHSIEPEAPTPIKSYQQSLEDTYEAPTVWARGTGSEGGDRYAAAVLGAVNAKWTGSDPYETIARKHEQIASSPDAAAEIYAEVSETTDEAVRRNLESLSGTTKGDTAKAIGVYEQLKKWKLDKDQPWGLESFTDQQLTGLRYVQEGSSSVAKEANYQRYANAIVGQVYEDRSTLNTIADFVAAGVAPVTTMRMGAFTDKFNPGAIGSVVNTIGETVGSLTDLGVDGSGYKAYKDTLAQFWGMPVEKRSVTFPMVEQHIREITGIKSDGSGNVFAYMGMMGPFVEKEAADDIKLDYLIDKANIAAWAIGGPLWKMAKSANNARLGRLPIGVLQSTGNDKLAASIINKALADTDLNRARKTTGMSRADIAVSAQPIDMSDLVSKQMKGLAAEAADQLGSEILKTQGTIDQAFIKLMDPSVQPRRFYFDDTAKMAKQQDVLGQVGAKSPYPTYARVKDRSENGFTVEVEYGSKYEGIYEKDGLEQANALHEQHIADLHERATRLREEIGSDFALRDAKASNDAVRAMDEYTSNLDTLGRGKGRLGKKKGDTNRYKDQIKETQAKIDKHLDKMPKDLDSAEAVERTRKVNELVQRLDALRASGKVPRGGERLGLQSMEERVDEAFGNHSEAKQIQNQISSIKDDIKKNNKILNNLDKPAKVETVDVKYTFNEQGANDVQELMRGTIPKIASPTQVVEQLHRGTVGNATLAELSESKIVGTFHTLQRDMLRNTSSAEKTAIDKLMLHGDEMGIERFGVDELLDGVNTKWGVVKLESKSSIAGYYGMRRMYQRLHEVENYVRTRALEVGGFKQLNAKILRDDGTPVKLYAKEYKVNNLGEPINRRGIPDGVKRIYDHQSGSIIDADDAEFLTRSKDWSVVQFRHGYKFGDEVINYGLIKPDKHLKNISGQVLDYHPGYVTKLRTGIGYTATREARMMVDGVKSPRFQTTRFFRTQQEGDAYWRGLSPAEQKATQILPEKAYKHSEYKTFDEEYDALNFGGLYTGERTDRTILMGLDGEEAHRVSAYKALSLYSGHVANRYSTNELKMNLIGRFQNSYGDHLINKGNWESPLNSKAYNDLSLRNSIEAQRDYIKDIIRTPDPGQIWFNQKMRNMAELMEGSLLGGKPRDWVMAAGNRNPTAALRTATFHIYLGMFNVSQFLVQGLGMTVAATAYPLKATKLIPKNFALRAMWHERGNGGAVSKILDGMGVDVEEMKAISREIDKTGLFASLKTSADYDAGINGISASGDAARRVLEAGLIPVREGEQFARGYGYLLARDVFLENRAKSLKASGKRGHANPSVELSQADIDQVTKDALKYTLNLNRSNKAFWQGANGGNSMAGNLLSIPTQFLQVTAKFYENMIAGSFDRSIRSKIPETKIPFTNRTFGGGEKTQGYGVRQWTVAEKTKIMLGHLAMFGMAGAPFMDSAVSGVTNLYREATNDPKEMTTDRLNVFNGVAGVTDAEFERAARGGISQVIAHWITGADPELNSRLSIPGGLEDSIDMYQHGDKSMLQALGGAAAPGLFRAWDAVHGMGKIFNSAYSDGMTDEELRQVARECFSIFSSTRNLDKSYWMDKIGEIQNSKGQKLVDMGDDEFNATVGWQAAGFGSAVVRKMYQHMQGTAELEARVTEATKLINESLDRYYPGDTLTQSESNERHLNRIVETILSDMTEEERLKVMKGVKLHLTDDKQRLIKAMAESANATVTAGGRSTSGTILNSSTGDQ